MKTKTHSAIKTPFTKFVAAHCFVCAASSALAQAAWQTVVIPDLPTGSTLGSVWARTRSEAYVWASRIVGNSPEAHLFRWDGAGWTRVLALTNYFPGRVFGTGQSEVFLSATHEPDGINGSAFAHILRSSDNGSTWTHQVLPSAVTNDSLGFGYIGGTANNVHVVTAAGILRFDGTDWNLIYTEPISGIYGLTLVSPNEGYCVTCFEWGNWDGTSWHGPFSGSLGCDVYGGVWGKRDAGGSLALYAVGQNGFNNGIRAWRFDEVDATWSDVLSVGSSGNGMGVWGSASNDVYIIGELISSGVHSGKVYHFDGSSWPEVTAVGSIPRPEGISGTAADDVWISLGVNGSLLHYAPLAPVVSIEKYAGLTVSGEIGATYSIQYATNLNHPNWLTLTNLVLPSSPHLFFDPTSAGLQGNRFYRTFRIF